MERTYNVPLRKGFQNTPRHKRAKKAVKVLREFMKKHMKADRVVLGQHVNDEIWKHGIKNPPHHVEVTAEKLDDGTVRVELEGHAFTQPEEPVEEEMGGLAEQLTGQ
jgi:large subunit ribosomal protein L31e